jgi:hypothetical protein
VSETDKEEQKEKYCVRNKYHERFERYFSSFYKPPICDTPIAERENIFNAICRFYWYFVKIATIK